MIFRSEPVLRVADDGRWILEMPVVYMTRTDEIIIVPAGFLTDLASIPRIFQTLFPVNGRHRSAAIVHDYLFVIQDRPRAAVDKIFLEAMEDCGVGWFQRRAMYLAVRTGGWVPWSTNAKALAEDRQAHLAANGLS